MNVCFHSCGRLLGKVLPQLLQRLVAVGDGVLLRLVHLGIRLALVLENRVPAWVSLLAEEFMGIKGPGHILTYQSWPDRAQAQSCPP